MWVDYTRRNDPACLAGLLNLREKLKKGNIPDVFCFWTKNPKYIGQNYVDEIMYMKKNGTVVLAQVTINPGYQEKLEPGIKSDFWDMAELIKILGGPDHVRLRFDPFIDGFTTPEMFKKHCEIAKEYGIRHTTVNFLVPGYKDVREALLHIGIQIQDLPTEIKTKIYKYILRCMVDIAKEYSVEVAVCAESSELYGKVYGILPAKCADPEWALNLGAKNISKGHPSRKGCGCCYSKDWGIYFNKGGYKCPHQCIYCYAK